MYKFYTKKPGMPKGYIHKTWLIMRLTTVILIATLMQVSAAGFAQRVTLNQKKTSLEKIFREIHTQTGYDFLYNREIIGKKQPISISVKDEALETVLQKCLDGQSLEYSIEDKMVVIMEKTTISKIKDFFALPITVSGKVTDTTGMPLPDATITIKGQNKTFLTNAEGTFHFPAEIGEEIIITFIGYQSYAFTVTNDLSFQNIRLKRSESKLDEIQVIAYGTTTQRFNVGSVSKVTAEDIAKQAISNPLEALQGRVPGLTVSTTSGIPGAAINIQIRGQNTLKPSSAQITPRDNPLFIIDGVPFAPQNGNINQFNSLAAPGDAMQYSNPYGGLSPFNSINPADIESIEILRDADATAIYGARGGNGVILITTKKGKVGKTDFNLNVRDGVSFAPNRMAMMNTQQYLDMRREAFSNDGLVPNNTLFDPAYAPDLTVYDPNRYTDWKKFTIGNTARDLNANASVSGGTANTQFRIGGGFNRDSYIFPGGFADNRANFSASIHHSSPEKKFNIDFTTLYSFDKNTSSGPPNLLSAYTLEPNAPELLDGNGNPVFNYKGVILDGSYAGGNPFAYLKRQYSITAKNLSANVLTSFEILKGFIFRTSLGYNNYNNIEYSGTPKITLSPNVTPLSSARFGASDLSAWIIEPQLEYKQTIKKHSLNVLLGSTFQRNGSTKTEMDGYGYNDDSLLGSVSGAATTSASDAFSEYKYNAIFGRINYRYDSKYLLNFNGRRDGSSRFGPSKQFGNFGSVGAGWIFSEEPLIKNNFSVLSYGKLRASYGITGSDNIADYQYVSRWAPARNAYGGVLGFTPQNLYNPDLSWASSKKLELGLETGLLHDRLLLSAAWYRNTTGNQLVTVPLPAQTGFQSVYENLGAVVQNTGWEFTVNANVMRSGNFIWNSTFNFTIPENKLVSFPGIENSTYSTIYFIGKSTNTVTGFDYSGVNPTTGLFQFRTASGQLTSTPASPALGRLNDYSIIGNTDPKFFGGFQNSFSFKGIQLDVFFEFKKQLGLNYLAQIYSYLPGQEYNLPVSFLDRWRAPGQQAEFQRLSTQYNTEYTAASNFVQSSGVYSDASYIRLKTITLSYGLPAFVLSKLGLHGLKIYATAQNLLTITRYKGSDPETQSFYGIPPLKSVSFGLNLNL